MKVNKIVSPTAAVTLGGLNAMALFSPTAIFTVAAKEEPTKTKPATKYDSSIVCRG